MAVVAIDRPVTYQEPDPGPAIRLREELEAFRDEGRTFGVAWGLAKRRAVFELRRSTQREMQEWLDVFEDHRLVWKAAYEGFDSYRCPYRKRVVSFPNVLALDQLTAALDD